MEKGPGLTVQTFADAMQKQAIRDYNQKYPPAPAGTLADVAVETFTLPHGYNDTVEHFRNFFESVRTRRQPVEDATFGFRASGAALLSNVSMQRNSVVEWNSRTMKIV